MWLSLVTARHRRMAALIRAVVARPFHSGIAHGCARSYGRPSAFVRNGAAEEGDLDAIRIDEARKYGAQHAAQQEVPSALSQGH